MVGTNETRLSVLISSGEWTIFGSLIIGRIPGSRCREGGFVGDYRWRTEWSQARINMVTRLPHLGDRAIESIQADHFSRVGSIFVSGEATDLNSLELRTSRPATEDFTRFASTRHVPPHEGASRA